MSLKLAIPALLALSFAIAPKASADVLYSNNFETSAADWSSGNADTVLTVNDDGTGNHVLDVNTTASTGSRPLVVPLSSSISLNDGDSVQLSFDVRLVSTPPTTSADRQFRFALFNSEGTTATTDDLGYIGRLDVGPNNTTDFDLSGEFTGTSGIFGVSGSAKHTSTSNAAATLNDNSVHTVTVLLKRTGADVFGSASFTSGATTVNIGPFDDTLASTNNTYSFDELAIGYNSGTTIEYTLDNVNVTSTLAAAAPEPASLGLFSLAAAPLLLRRRKA